MSNGSADEVERVLRGLGLRLKELLRERERVQREVSKVQRLIALELRKGSRLPSRFQRRPNSVRGRVRELMRNSGRLSSIQVAAALGVTQSQAGDALKRLAATKGERIHRVPGTGISRSEPGVYFYRTPYSEF